jgi:hypothetical protein
MERRLTELYPAGQWSDIHAAFPGITRVAIYQRARLLGLHRWNPGTVEMGSILTGEATEGEIGWLAGFIDGEGTLQLRRAPRRDKGAFYYSPLIRVVNNSLEAAEQTRRIMGGFMYENRPGLWAVVLTGLSRVERVLTILLPLLTVKRERALLLLEYAETRRSHGDMRAAYGDDEERIYQAFYAGSGRASASRVPRVSPNGVTLTPS